MKSNKPHDRPPRQVAESERSPTNDASDTPDGRTGQEQAQARRKKVATLLFCVNERSGGRPSCAHADANRLRKYAKEKAVAIEAAGGERIKVKKAGCLGYCSRGPVIEVLPEKAFYRYDSEADIDTLFDHYLEQQPRLRQLLLGRKKG